jgi:hypothetical protein
VTTLEMILGLPAFFYVGFYSFIFSCQTCCTLVSNPCISLGTLKYVVKRPAIVQKPLASLQHKTILMNQS